ncbi:MAG: class I SAM-dependent methyltransferase [Clostridia bacterium]|nr:class I SAM-dependent methyltransferase [Clostridia bacterium]
MNSYTKFARLYDSLMNSDINYEQWADYIENMLDRYCKSPKLICDLACGTGNITLPLSARGYDMIGVDKSFDMLSIAREKAAEKNLDIMFLQQDLKQLDLYGSCDAFLCMIDGFNYILNPNTLYKIAKRIKTCFLEPDGIFIFDLSSEYKLKTFIGDNTFIHDGDDIFYTWENKFYEKPKMCDMYLNFFVKSGGGYKRFGERHLQHAYCEEEIRRIFLAAGFSQVDAYSPLSFDKPKKDDMRIVFAAK